MIDFSIYCKSKTYYGGSERKFGISVDGYEFMIKLMEN